MAQWSENRGEIAAALSAAQGEFATVAKTDNVSVAPKDGGRSYTFRFAPLEELVEMARPILAKHQLCVTQDFPATPDRTVVCETTVSHTSGQWVVTTTPAFPVGGTPQAVGSAMSFAARYGYQHTLRIVAGGEDDDGGAAAGNETHRMARAPEAGAAQSTREPGLMSPAGDQARGREQDLVAARERVTRALHAAGYETADAMQAQIRRLAGGGDVKILSLSRGQLARIQVQLETLVRKRKEAFACWREAREALGLEDDRDVRLGWSSAALNRVVESWNDLDVDELATLVRVMRDDAGA